jgi:ectoine hydroxylase-related dioxygenase (phytanoyl-CoA dioxygenase family)
MSSEERQDDDGETKEDEDVNSADEALCEILGLTSLGSLALDEKEDDLEASNFASLVPSRLPHLSEDLLRSVSPCRGLYHEESMFYFPSIFFVPGSHVRRITDELVWGGERIQADRTYETIKVLKNGTIEERRTLTRLENFVNSHPEWSELCNDYLRRCLSAALGMEMTLYKEKLNMKPPGGSGFAPHLDTPSLRIALGPDGPQTFCTIMVAIDNMSIQNGCLRICKGPWTEENHCEIIEPEIHGNPDAGGRAGAVPTEATEKLAFEEIACQGGTVVAFNGWAPHRSAPNTSPFPRRAVFLTYNPLAEGDFHDKYYEKMEQKRNTWRESVGFVDPTQRQEDEQIEVQALATMPKS